MSESMLVALVSGGITALASIMVCWIQNNKSVAIMEERQNTMISQLNELKDKIGKHNNFEGRLIKLEEHRESVEKRITSLERA